MGEFRSRLGRSHPPWVVGFSVVWGGLSNWEHHPLSPTPEGWLEEGPAKEGSALQTWGICEKGQRHQLSQDSPPFCPHPALQMRWPPGPLVPTCSPESWELCLPWSRALRSPLDPRACDDEMAAWAASHGDGFQALKWAERDERPQEGHFF